MGRHSNGLNQLQEEMIIEETLDEQLHEYEDDIEVESPLSFGERNYRTMEDVGGVE